MKRKEDLIKEIQKDIRQRQDARKSLESKWLLNINFLQGNQNLGVAPNGEIIDINSDYLWQNREVYNHIAPIIETRLAKFTRVRTELSVRPASGEDGDIKVAKLAAKLIETTQRDNLFDKLSQNANYWSEVTGTVFYKIFWDSENLISDTENVGVKIAVCPPYEIYPDSLSCQDIDKCRSIIHARIYPIEVIQDKYGIEIKKSKSSFVDIESSFQSKKYKVVEKDNYALVIEKYQKPTKNFPDGRLSIVCGDYLLYDGELPYINDADGKRGFPFIRQVSLESPSSFFGQSIIERIIPVQRAYNSIKNRKHEFMSRLSAGVLAVEEGSCDVEDLQDEGLAPGKIIKYRQGSVPPNFINPGSVPFEFRDEEIRLLNEFTAISGVSDFLTNSIDATTSGYALSLLLEQDETRLSVTASSIRNAVKEIGIHIIRLFRQFGRSKKMVKISGINNETEIIYFLGSELNSDDVILTNHTEIQESPSVRKNMVMEIMKLGLLNDERGQISLRNKSRALELLGFGNWEEARNFDDIHIKKANTENEKFKTEEIINVEEVDNHELHIDEHIQFIIARFDKTEDKEREKILEHIREHKILRDINYKAESNKFITKGVNNEQ